MTKLINSTLDVRDKATITLLAKTVIRRKELITLDVNDLDWVDQSIRLEPTPKRTNWTVLFDDETAIILLPKYYIVQSGHSKRRDNLSHQTRHLVSVFVPSLSAY